MSRKLAKGDGVCFLGENLTIEISTIEGITFDCTTERPNHIKMEGYPNWVELGDRPMIYPKEKQKRLHEAIQRLKLVDETDMDKLQAMLFDMMEGDEYRPLYLPVPCAGRTGCN